METEIGAFEAKTQLSKLLELVRKGERVIITRRGVPVAQLTPVGPERPGDTSKIIKELQSIRKRTKAGAETLQALIEEGRRF